MSKTERERFQYKLKLKKLEDQKWSKAIIVAVVICGTLLILTALFTI